MQVSPTSPLWNTVNIVAYKLTAHALVVSWENIGQSPLDLDSLNSFQVAITDGSDPLAPDGNNVSFCYREVQWVVGNQFGLDPSPATVGTNWGNGVDFMQVGRFGFTDSVWNGQMTWSGSGWLNGRHVAFNAGPLPVPPFYSTKECDTVEVNVGDTGHYVITAHRGGPAPPMSAYSTCSSLTNYTVANQTVDGSHVLTSTFIPVEGEEGLHTMYFQASTGIGLPSTTQRYIKVNGPLAVVEHIRGETIFITPNPTTDETRIAWGAFVAGEAQLIDAQGRMLKRWQPGTPSFNLSVADLPPGIYTVRLLKGDRTAAARLAVGTH